MESGWRMYSLHVEQYDFYQPEPTMTRAYGGDAWTPYLSLTHSFAHSSSLPQVAARQPQVSR